MEQVAMITAAVAGLAVTALSGFLLIPLLRRLKFGQTINEIGPTWHSAKQGTPTMGGFMFILGSCLGVLVAWPMLATSERAMRDPMGTPLLLVGMLVAIAFAAIGFVDDYLKVVHKQNLGLNAKGKLIMQCVVAICFMVALHLMGRLSTVVRLPFFGAVDFGLFFYPISLLLMVGMNNATNLTDGIDGLCSSVTFWVMCGYLAILVALDSLQLATWASALAGACLGFLLWNFYPAKVFMGDVGSLYLGGAVVALGYCFGRPDILFILGIVYLLEALSVMLQVGVFKLTKRFSKDKKGRRIFRMSPIHHHFEMSGWSEVHIDTVFSIAAVLCAVGAYVYAVVFG